MSLRSDRLGGIFAVSQRSCEWIVGDGINQPIPQGIAGVQLLGSEKHLQRAGLTNEPRKALGASPSGDETQGGAAMSEDGVRAGDSVMAREREVQSSAHAVAVNGSDGWSREVGDAVHQPLPHLGELEGFGAVQLGNLTEIGSSRKEMRVTGNHKPDGRVFCKRLDCHCQRSHAGASEAIGAIV